MFKAYNIAKTKCGLPGDEKNEPPRCEIEYLDALVRGVYARRDLEAGETLTKANTYLAIPLQKGQFSCREIKYNEILKTRVKADAPVAARNIETNGLDERTLKMIDDRGL